MIFKPSPAVRKIILVTFALLLPLLIFSTTLKPWGPPLYVITILSDVIVPLQRGMFQAVSGSRDLLDKYVFLKDQAESTLAMRKELEQMYMKLMDYSEKQNEINSLRSTLQLRQSLPYPMLPTEVISGGQHLPFQTVLISGGSGKGIRPGMPVINAEGLIGKVLRVGLLHADVVFLTDTAFNVDVLLQRTRERGIVEGVGRNSCLLKLSKRSDVKIGDVIITSGLVGSYPRGIPVGEVAKITYESDLISQKIVVKPTVDLGKIDFAAVLLIEDRELEKLETLSQGSLINGPGY